MVQVAGAIRCVLFSLGKRERKSEALPIDLNQLNRMLINCKRNDGIRYERDHWCVKKLIPKKVLI